MNLKLALMAIIVITFVGCRSREEPLGKEYLVILHADQLDYQRHFLPEHKSSERNYNIFNGIGNANMGSGKDAAIVVIAVVIVWVTVVASDVIYSHVTGPDHWLTVSKGTENYEIKLNIGKQVFIQNRIIRLITSQAADSIKISAYGTSTLNKEAVVIIGQEQIDIFPHK